MSPLGVKLLKEKNPLFSVPTLIEIANPTEYPLSPSCSIRNIV